MHYLHFRAIFIFIILAYSVQVKGQCPPEAIFNPLPFTVSCAGDWQMVFEDHFEGNSLNTNDWYTTIPNPKPSDRTLFVDFDGPQGEGIYTEGQKYEDYNVSVSGGSAKIKTQQENVNYSGIWEENQNKPPEQVGMIGDPFSFDFKYSSGVITTKKRYNATKGLKIEARFKIPPGQGLWPAFWIYSGNNEIDIFEPKEKNKNLKGEANVQALYTYNCREQYNIPDNDFHIWTAEITPFYVHILIDDVLVVNVTKYVAFNGLCGDYFPAGLYTRNLSFPEMDNSNWWVIFNTAIFRDFAENETVQGLPSSLEIDYIKIYQRDLCKTTVDDYTTLNVASGENIVLSGNQFFEKITVQDGGSLTFDNAHVKMDHQGTVNLIGSASLVLNKSIIRSCVSESRWKGLSLSSVGNNVPTLHLKNNSTLEKSVFGISNHPTLGGISWDEFGNAIANGSGMNLTIEDESKIKDHTYPLTIIGTDEALNVKIEDATFFENEYGVKIIANSSTGISIKRTIFTEFHKDAAIEILQNNSENIIDDCTFNDNLIGISAIESKGTSVTKSEFDGNYNANATEDRIGIHSFESNIMIYDDNLFKDNYYGVLSEGTFPLSAGLQLGSLDAPKNIFEQNYFSIESSGNDAPEQVNVINNKIDHSSASNASGFYGVAGTLFLGANLANFKNNTTISPQTGFNAGATGDNSNLFNCNQFVDNVSQEMAIKGDNSNSAFYENSFESPDVSGGSVNLYGAKVLDQGDLARSAANCFVFQTTADITAYAGTQPFDYFYFGNPDQANCEYPESPVGFDPIESLDPGSYCDNNIGTVNIIGGGGYTPFELFPPLHPDSIPCNDCVRDNIDYWVNVIINTGGDNPLTSTVEPITNPNYDYTSDQMLEDWINYGLYVAMQDGDLPTGVQILSSLNKWKWKIRLYGLYVWFQEYELAKTVLNSLPVSTAEEANFNDVQQINMARLQSPFAYYVPTLSEKNDLIRIANSNMPSAGYARSLYHKLTGEILPVTIDLPSLHSSPRLEFKSK